jgi:hypothetical protein
MGMTGSVGSAMASMESLLTHAISFPGEELTENLRIKSSFPEQPGFSTAGVGSSAASSF